MTPDQEKQAESIISRQVSMSGQTLDALRRAGLTDSTKIQLDFLFNAPNERAARVLVAHLEENECVDVVAEKVGGFLSRKYTVRGKTQETNLTPEVLGQWLPWIVVQGIVHGCVFDGWGAEI